jgi:hypothetical protein
MLYSRVDRGQRRQGSWRVHLKLVAWLASKYGILSQWVYFKIPEELVILILGIFTILNKLKGKKLGVGFETT